MSDVIIAFNVIQTKDAQSRITIKIPDRANNLYGRFLCCNFAKIHGEERNRTSYNQEFYYIPQTSF